MSERPVDREQLREQAEAKGTFIAGDGHLSFRVPKWDDVLALLDALEAAERERDNALDARGDLVASWERTEAAQARVVLLEAQLDKLLPIARQIVHSNDVVTDPQATNAARTSASMSEQEGIMCLAEWLAAVSVADSGEETGPADGVRVSAGSDHRTSGASTTPVADSGPEEKKPRKTIIGVPRAVSGQETP